MKNLSPGLRLNRATTATNQSHHSEQPSQLNHPRRPRPSNPQQTTPMESSHPLNQILLQPLLPMVALRPTRTNAGLH